MKEVIDYRNYILTPEERRAILSKEAFTIEDIAKLYGFRYADAQQLVLAIRRHSKDRLHRSGIVHVLDYCEHFGMTLVDLRGAQ